jgi:hypothetical protein
MRVHTDIDKYRFSKEWLRGTPGTSEPGTVEQHVFWPELADSESQTSPTIIQALLLQVDFPATIMANLHQDRPLRENEEGSKQTPTTLSLTANLTRSMSGS